MGTAYDILGVPPDAPMEAIRAAYLKAARLHHPDKLGHLDAEERGRHEAIFKETTDAYSKIVESRARASTTGGADAFVRAWSAPKKPEEWESIWEGVERMFSNTEVLCTVKDLFVKAQKLKKEWAAAKAASGTSSTSSTSSASSANGDVASPHTKATLLVSAADVQSGRKRRVRILLAEGAVNLNVDCGVFPEPYREGLVEVKLVLREEDAAEYEDGIWDLFKTLHLNIADWLTGGDFTVTALVTGGKPLIVSVPACFPLDTPITVHNLAFWKFGPIYVSVALNLPTHEEWMKHEENNTREKVLAVLRDVVCIGGKKHKST